MSVRRWHLVTYDVREPTRLRLVARRLEGYGERIQYSVFRCRLASIEMERLRWELSRIMEPEDALLVVPLCERCTAGIHTQGGPAWPREQPTYVIV